MGCVGKLENLLSKNPAVFESSIDVYNKIVFVKYDKNATTAELISEDLKTLHKEVIIISKNKPDSSSFYFKVFLF